ncbi:MAG: ribbon-helix-helix domain-containing protein [Acetobacteraceae bacterium]|nr:ribbon-helix-helix domain-containing protein [Acetobacteraceae bacterium]
MSGTAQGAARGPERSGLVKRSFALAGHRTSVALEDEFWSALGHIAAARGRTVSALVMEVDAGRTGARPLASELRVFALSWFRGSAPGR